MQRIVTATFLGLALAGPAAAQSSGVQQMLQGLTNGNQGHDQALNDAFERGYQRGRQDEARQQRADRGSNNRYGDMDQNGRNQNGRGVDGSYGGRNDSSDR
jgi:hypothetical protein